MNVFQNCQNTSDAVPLYLPQQLYLKPIAKVNISIQLPNIRKIGKSISHWEVMDKLKALVKPDEFTILKVTKTTLEFVRFEAEVDLKSKLEKVISRLDNRMIKLKDFNEMMRVRAAEAKSDCPNRRTWDGFFDESKDMDESKPGERADTIHLANLPTKWFVPYHQSGDEDITPSETLFYRIFEKFGKIRFVDIPICDPYRNKMKDHISGLKQSSFEDKRFFEAYVQFKDYIGFAKAMDAFRDMKLLHKEEDDDAVAVKIKVDFDKSKHLSDASIRRREIVRERLVKKTREKEEKEKVELEEKNRQDDLERQKEQDLKIQKEIRRKVREEKRKLKILNKLEINGSDEINEKIAKEERKLVKVQRKLEAIRLVEELFRRVKEKNQEKDDLYDKVTLGHKELKKFKDTSELAVLTQREKLHHAIKGRVMLKTILSGTKLKNFSSSSSDTSDADETKTTSQRRPMTPPEMIPNSEPVYDPIWYGFPYQLHPAHNLYAPPMRGMFNTKHMVNLRHNPGTSRGTV